MAGDSPPGPRRGVEITCRVYRPRKRRESAGELVVRHPSDALAHGSHVSRRAS